MTGLFLLEDSTVVARLPVKRVALRHFVSKFGLQLSDCLIPACRLVITDFFVFFDDE